MVDSLPFPAVAWIILLFSACFLCWMALFYRRFREKRWVSRSSRETPLLCSNWTETGLVIIAAFLGYLLLQSVAFNLYQNFFPQEQGGETSDPLYWLLLGAPLQIGLLGGFYMASRLFGLKALREGTWFNSFYRAAWWFLLMLPVVLLSNLFWAWLIRQFGIVPEEQFLVRLLADGTFQGPFLIAFFLFAAVLAPVAEELFFRGWLFPVLSSRLNWIAAAATSGLCFSLLHGHPSGLLPLMLLGIVLAWSYHHTADIRVPILIHSFFNANTFLILILAGDKML